MFALVENNEFVKILNDRKGFIGTADNIEIVWEERTRTVEVTDEEGNAVLDENGDVQTREETYKESTEVTTQQEVKYSKDVFTKWSNAEREAIGIYEVSVDNTNKKDEAYYINTDISYSFDGSSVIGSYGTATPKPLDDVLFTQSEIDTDEDLEGVEAGDVKQYGLKGLEIKKIKAQAGGLLAPTDWHVVKATEVADYSVPTDIATYRANVRAKSNEIETQINACTTVDELKALYEYTEDAEGNITRPLAKFPEEL
jgi:hypothetical protein